MPKVMTLLMAAAFMLACQPIAFAAASPPAVATGASPAPHIKRHFARHWHKGRWMHQMGRQLDLSRAQRENMRKLMHEDFRQMLPQRRALRLERLAFHNTLPDNPKYKAATQTLARAEANFKLNQVARRANLRAEFYGLLTPAQRTHLAALQAQRQERMKWRKAHRQHTGA